MSEIESELQRSIKADETIEFNGNVIKEGSISQKKSEKSVKHESQFDDFNDGHREISSIIHSTSALKDFQNPTEKMFSTVKHDA